jgi:hypothetical protein
VRRRLVLGLALIAATDCAGAPARRRPVPEATCPALRFPVFAETEDPCAAADVGAGEPPSCVPERSRGRLLVQDDDLGLRVFQACRDQPSAERDRTVDVDPRRVMVERMGSRQPDLHELAVAADGLPRRGRHGATDIEQCPGTGGPKRNSHASLCVTVLLPDRDLPTVLRMLSSALRDLGDVCLPLTVELGVPPACLPGPLMPAAGSLK